MKKCTLSILLIMLLLGLSGVSYAKVQLDYAIVGFASVLPLHAELIDAFNASQSDIEVIMRNMPGDAENKMLEKLAVEIATGEGPDVIYLNDKALPAFAKTGAFADITTYVERDMKKDVADFFPASVDAYRQGKGLYGFPGILHAITVYYNQDLLDQAGVKYTSKWTIDDFTTIGRKTTITNNDGVITQFGIHGLNWWPAFLPFLWGYGGDFFDPVLPDRDSFIAKADTRESLDAFHWLEMLAQDKLIGGGAFFTGTAAMRISNSSEAGYITFGKNWDYGHIPIGPTGARYSRFSSTGWVMGNNSKDKEASWQLLRYLFKSENIQKFATSSNGLGSRRSVVGRQVQLANSTVPQHKSTLLEILEYAKPHPTCTLDVTAIEATIRKWYGSLYTGQIDYLTAGNSLQADLKALLP